MNYSLSGITLEQNPNPNPNPKKVIASFKEPATGNDLKIRVTLEKPLLTLSLDETIELAIASCAKQR